MNKLYAVISAVFILLSLPVSGSAQTANDYYNAQYMNCLRAAQQKTQYVHPSIRDETMGKMLDACMYKATGNDAYAPINREDQLFYEDTYLYSGG